MIGAVLATLAAPTIAQPGAPGPRHPVVSPVHVAAMIVQAGSNRRGGPVRNANPGGIAGTGLARPVARGMAGGAAIPANGIDGATVHRHR